MGLSTFGFHIEFGKLIHNSQIMCSVFPSVLSVWYSNSYLKID